MCPIRTPSKYGFNTSHVTLYQMLSVICSGKQEVSIHHMLLFILKSVFTGETETCFNTSHVTLYLNTTVVYADIGGFQYITCYSLSSRQRTRFLVWSVSIHHMLLFIGSGKSLHCAKMMFQYITCYSLSTNLQESTASIYRFNTSHVTLYLIPAHGIKRDVRFNTSHVTLYLEESEAMNSPEVFQYITCYSLSENQMQEQFPEIMFQYITCYSLSLQGTQRSNHCRVSIHHMLLFIEKMCEWNMAGNRVSIHHMLLFIVGIRFKTGPGNMFQYITCYSLSVKVILLESKHFRFNTSHVTLYRCTEM